MKKNIYFSLFQINVLLCFSDSCHGFIQFYIASSIFSIFHRDTWLSGALPAKFIRIINKVRRLHYQFIIILPFGWQKNAIWNGAITQPTWHINWFMKISIFGAKFISLLRMGGWCITKSCPSHCQMLLMKSATRGVSKFTVVFFSILREMYVHDRIFPQERLKLSQIMSKVDTNKIFKCSGAPHTML